MAWCVHQVRGWDLRPPPLAGSRTSGHLIVLAGGRCVWDDWLQAKRLGFQGDLMAVNDVGCYIHDQLAHWVSLHKEYFPYWTFWRRNHAYNTPVRHTHAHVSVKRNIPEVDIWWDLEFPGGSSAMLAVLVGLAIGYDRILLCGVPLNRDGHFFEPPWQKSPEIDNYPDQIVWQMQREKTFENKVRSMSGKTQTWLGPPTEEWIR